MNSIGKATKPCKISMYKVDQKGWLIIDFEGGLVCRVVAVKDCCLGKEKETPLQAF